MLTYLLSSQFIPNAVQTGSFMLVFTLILFFDRKIWLNFERLISLIAGLFLLLTTELLLKFQTIGDIEIGHIFLARFFGLLLLSSVFYSFITFINRDGTVPISYLTAKSTSCCMILVAILYAYFTPSAPTHKLKLNHDQFITLTGLISLLSLLGHLFFLSTSGDYSSYPYYHIRFQMHLRLDFLLSIIKSFAIYAFPQLIIKYMKIKSDPVNMLMLRLIASQEIFSSVISIQTGTYLNEKDKTNRMYWRIIDSVLQMVFIGVYYFGFEQFTNKYAFYCFITYNLLLMINAIFSLGEGAFIIHDYHNNQKKSDNNNVDESWFVARKTPEKLKISPNRKLQYN